jgi:hypothetical protein
MTALQKHHVSDFSYHDMETTQLEFVKRKLTCSLSLPYTGFFPLWKLYRLVETSSLVSFDTCHM